MIHDSIPLVFFGTPEPAAEIFEHLRQAGYVPKLAITNPDRPKGRKMLPASPPVKLWATKNNIPVLQPENLCDPAFIKTLRATGGELFIVIAYGKILPKEVLEIPKKGSLNVHYSLLPKYRGASPIESAILNDDRQVGVSILLLDEQMDHGPVVAERRLGGNFPIYNFHSPPITWPPTAEELRKACDAIAAKLLAETIPLWIEGKIKAEEQKHAKATYTKKIKKEDGLIDFSDDQYKNFLKIQAYKNWPKAYFFKNIRGRKTRIIIVDASYADGKLTIKRVIPEGKNEMTYEELLRRL